MFVDRTNRIQLPKSCCIASDNLVLFAETFVLRKIISCAPEPIKIFFRLTAVLRNILSFDPDIGCPVVNGMKHAEGWTFCARQGAKQAHSATRKGAVRPSTLSLINVHAEKCDRAMALEIQCTVSPYRRFESDPFRQPSVFPA